MRIRSLNLPRFKNLTSFHVDFDDSAAVSVLVGRNGTGKSNILEALTIIFRDLDLGLRPQFPYEILYECRGRLIRVAATEQDGGISQECSVDGRKLGISKLTGPAGQEYRPTFVFGYYSGPSNRLEEHFALHQDRFYRALVRGIERPFRPLFYARTVLSNFVLLAFFLEDDDDIRRLLRDHLGIEAIDSVLFVMQQPSWTSKFGDPRFWNARGTVKTLLDRLYALSLAPLRLQQRISIGRRTIRSELLYLYLPDVEATRDLASAYESTQEFFKALESTYISDLISDVRIRVSLRRVTTSLTFRELSEGEQQLLLVLGLMRFTREDQSLFLLDEPDTHLNPAWSVQYREFLRTFGALDETSHVLMATHDPLVVAGLLKSEVRILERGPDGKVLAYEPWEDPRGMGVGALLTSDVYGMRSQLDLETLRRVDRKRELAAAEDLSEEEIEELSKLNAELADLGFLTEDRDPDFQEYLRAKSEIEEDEESGRVFLSREEMAEQRERSIEIMEQLLSDPQADDEQADSSE